jgi:hypothetical protein
VSYDKKYQSNFYNVFGKLVEVKIYKKDYGTHPVINLRNCEVSLEVNFQDENTPIVGTGLRVVIINQGDFTSLDDLLTSQERQFECVVVYDNTIVFDGFSLCDLNEQQFIPWSKITLQFTDYLRRLDGSFAPCLANVGGSFDIYTLLQDAIQAVGLTRNLHVNSSLFETRMNKSVNDTFLEQTNLDNIMFYSDANTYDNIYDALNKALKSFNAFFYSFGDKWVLERYDDITRSPSTQTWVVFANMLNSAEFPGSADANLREWYNKQNGDFSYSGLSQVIEYDAGLQKLILQLKDKQLDTLVFNDYKIGDILTVTDTAPHYDVLLLRKWYTYYTNTVFRTGLMFRSMVNFVEWKCDTTRNYDRDGLYYHFKVTFNPPINYVINPILSVADPTILTIDFKQSVGVFDLSQTKLVRVTYVLMIGDWYLREVPDPTGNLFWDFSPTLQPLYEIFDVSVTGNKDGVVNISRTINLTDSRMVVPGIGLDPMYLPSLWEQLGNPPTIDMVIMFFPISIELKQDIIPDTLLDNYIGDVQINIASQKVPNKLTYYINDDFVKTETQEMDFFDLINDNFSNGPFMIEDSVGADKVRTETWSTYQHPIAAPLMDVYARVKFGNYCHTLHKLKGTIIHDGYIKPFSILTDDNLKDDSGNNIELILRGYTWNLNEGTYEIGETTEFTEEALGVPGTPSGGDESSAGLPIETYWVDISSAGLNWAWNDTTTKIFEVTTNMPQWYLFQEYSIDEPLDLFTWYVYDSTNTTKITNEVYTSGMVVRVTPKTNNVGITNKVVSISITNESNEVMATMIGTQSYTNADNPPVVTNSNDGTLSLSYFNHTLATSSSSLTIWWTPTGSGLTDYDIYIIVKRAGVLKAYVLFPHNFDGTEQLVVIPLSEAAIAGAIYDVNFSTTSNT